MLRVKRQSNPRSYLRATIGTNQNTPFISSEVLRVEPRRLIQSYGMWAHRAVTLKASVSASIPFRLFTIGNSKAVKRIKQFGPRDVNTPTKRFMQGRCEVGHNGVVRKALQGNTEDLTELTSHPILDLLNDVNGWDEGYSWWEQVYTDLDIYGDDFNHIVFEGAFPSQLWRMDPTITKIIPSTVDFVDHYEFGRGTEKQLYDTDEVLWFSLNDPANPYAGFSWLAAWLSTVDASHAIANFQLWLMQRGGNPDYVVIDKDRSMAHPKQQRVFRRLWSKMFGRLQNREHTVAFLHGEAEIKRLSETNRELEFNKSETTKRDQIAAASGVPVAFLDSDRIAANSREAMNQFKMLTIWPIIQRVQDRINQRFVHRFWDERLLLVADNPIQEDRALRITERESQLRTGTPLNEIRAEDGDEEFAFPEADMSFIPSDLTVMEGLQAKAELGVEGAAASLEAIRNPPPQIVAPTQKPPPKGLTVKDVMEITRSISRPVAKPVEIPQEAKASAILGMKMLAEGKQGPPIVNVTSPDVIVNLPEMSPNIQVEVPPLPAPVVNVSSNPPSVAVNVPPAQAPIVNVAVPPDPTRDITITRDRNGVIQGARVQ